jgi:hypothetical protein
VILLEAYPRKRRDDLEAITARARALVDRSAFKEAVRKETAKANKKVAAEKVVLKTQLDKKIKAFEQGKITHKQMVSSSADTIKKSYETSFELGLRAQGRGSFGIDRKKKKLANATEKAWLQSEIDDEIRYLKKFLDDVKRGAVPSDDDEDAEPSPKMRKGRRVKMYSDALDSVYAAGQVYGAPAGSVIHWVRTIDESCPECILLESLSPFTKENLPTTPRAGHTRCLSNCKCRLAIDLPSEEVYNAVSKAGMTRAQYNRLLKISREQRHGLPKVAVKANKGEAKARAKARTKRNI